MIALKHRPETNVELYTIAHEMQKNGLSADFIDQAIQTALSYEGVADLIRLWASETNCDERTEIIADIQEMIDECRQQTTEEYPYIKFNDLKTIARDIRSFKDSLLLIVNERGGISHLSLLTGIPQPSLSRFFNSNSMPHRSTLLKIAQALHLDAVTLSTPWSK